MPVQHQHISFPPRIVFFSSIAWWLIYSIGCKRCLVTFVFALKSNVSIKKKKKTQQLLYSSQQTSPKIWKKQDGLLLYDIYPVLGWQWAWCPGLREPWEDYLDSLYVKMKCSETMSPSFSCTNMLFIQPQASMTSVSWLLNTSANTFIRIICKKIAAPIVPRVDVMVRPSVYASVRYDVAGYRPNKTM